MKVWELFEDANTRNNRILEEIRRANRVVKGTVQSQDEQLAALADENAKLKLQLVAVINVLIAKNVVALEDIEEMILSMIPPPQPPEEVNPFEGLRN